MDMDNLTRSQFILLVLLISFVTSLVTGVVTVSLMSQVPGPITQTMQKVIEKITPGVEPQVALPPSTPSYNNQDELVVKLVKQVSPAVVSVIATKDVPVFEQYFVNPFGDDNFFNFQIPQYLQKGTEKQQVSSGSGFFISKDGLVLTNKHVVEDTAADYSVILNDGRKLEAKVLARDPFQDIAILKVQGDNFNYIPLGDSDSLNVGQTVIAIGNALGEFRNTVSMGIISGLHRSITAEGALSGPEKLQELIQTDAAINPGNSGGPLLDLSGKVIGINSALAQSAENIGFALPINIAKRDTSDAIAFGKIKYPYIGIRYKITDKGNELVKGANGEPAVEPGSPADKAGLKEGDIILDNITEILSRQRVGDKITLRVLRDNKEIKVDIILGEKP